MSRAFCIPAIFFLFSAFVLLFITSISLPYLTTTDITRVTTNGAIAASGAEPVLQLRLGIWSYCYTPLTGNVACGSTGHGYSLSILNINDQTVNVGSSWTRGLAIHPVACAISFAAFLLSFSQHLTTRLIASLVSFLAAIITLIAFAIDIALYAYFKHQMGTLGLGSNTTTGPGFWLTFVAMILLFLGGFTVCFGRRRERMSGSSYRLTPTTGFSKFFHN